MTTMSSEPRALWSSMPGWGIVADLTPPELLAERRAAVVRKYVVITLAALIVLVVLLFAFAFFKKSAAQHAVNQAQDTTTGLQGELRQYADVVTMQGSVTQVKGQVATLLKTDVDVPALLANLQGALPPGVAINNLSITISSPTAAGAGPAAGGTGSNLDPGPAVHIGSVQIGGNAGKLTDVSTFVDKLRTLKGVVEPYPASNTEAGTGVTFSIQATLTSDLFTHRFDVTDQPGAK